MPIQKRDFTGQEQAFSGWINSENWYFPGNEIFLDFFQSMCPGEAIRAYFLR